MAVNCSVLESVAARMFGKKVVAVQVAAGTVGRCAEPVAAAMVGRCADPEQVAAATVGRYADPELFAAAVAARCVVQDLVVEAIAGSVAPTASANFAAAALVVDCGSELRAAPE